MHDSVPVSYEVEENVALITLNRPERANSWTVETHLAYLRALDRANADPDVRAIVLTGAGRHFCAGADLSMLETFKGGAEVPAELEQSTFLTPLRCRKPLIGAVNGSAAGLGFAIALMCDIRFAAERAVFTTSFAKLGLVAENGVSWLLPQVVGRSRALDLLLSARRVDSDEARRIGLVDRVCGDDAVRDEALDYARALARSCSPASFDAIKRQVNRHAWLPAHQAEEEGRVLVAEALAGDDFDEGIAAFLSKRDPTFPPLGQGTRFSTFED